MNLRLTKLDELHIKEHSYLDSLDECYFLGEYTARMYAQYSDTNQLIYNLKKGVERKGLDDYKYKQSAINQIANHISSIGNIGDWTIIPIPPSREKQDQFYDDRLVRVLAGAKEKNPAIDYRELVIQLGSYQASHLSSGSRQSPSDLAGRYSIDASLVGGLKRNIIIFDDVLTAGSHFSAMKSFLSKHIAYDRIIGLFVARTTRDSDLDL